MANESRGSFRDLLDVPGLHIAPGVTNAFYARIAESVGFGCVFVTGGGVANTLLGTPDLGLTTLTETVQVTERIAGAVAVPVVADGDTGYGNHINVARTVQALERAGATAVTLEDQVAPKRCGHFDGKDVISVDEMVRKLVSADLARSDPDLMIIARTDAIAVEGFDAALERGMAYVEAGADAVFVEAPRTREQLASIPAAIPAPCVVNMVEGGITPLLGAEALNKMGYRVAIYANLALRVAARSVQEAFSVLLRDGTSAQLIERIMPWEERQALAGYQRWESFERKVDSQARRILESRSRLAREPTRLEATARSVNHEDAQ